MKKTFELEFYGKKLVVETGEIAKQASFKVIQQVNEHNRKVGRCQMLETGEIR